MLLYLDFINNLLCFMLLYLDSINNLTSSMLLYIDSTFLQNRMEIFKGAKDEIIQQGFFHTLHIKKLSMKDSGSFTLMIDGVTTSCTVFVRGNN